MAVTPAIVNLITRLRSYWRNNGQALITGDGSGNSLVDLVDTFEALVIELRGNNDSSAAIHEAIDLLRAEIKGGVTVDGDNLKKLRDLIIDLDNAKQATLAYTPENAANKNQANGYSGLNAFGKIDPNQLPAGIDDIIEVDLEANLPTTGTTGVMYILLYDNRKQLRWSGTGYMEWIASPGSSDGIAEGVTNLFFQEARVLATIVANLVTTQNSPIQNGDALIVALGKIQAQLNNKVNAVAGSRLITEAEATKLANMPNDATTQIQLLSQAILAIQQSTTNLNSDNVTEGQTNKFWTEARTLGTKLKDLITNVAGDITADDTLLSAFGKLIANINALATTIKDQVIATLNLSNKVDKTGSNLPNYFKGAALYNWNAVNTGKLAPAGWRIPTDTDFQTLINFLGSNSAGGKLKETGTTNWLSPNTGATNETQFTARGVGFRNQAGQFVYIKQNVGFWSSTSSSTDLAWFILLSNNAAYISRSDEYKRSGYNVRCMRDTDPGVSQITDYDGNVYDVIQIGTQWWLKQDWKCTHYNDGEVISNVTDNAEWAALTTGALCYYNNQPLTYKLISEDSEGNLVKIDPENLPKKDDSDYEPETFTGTIKLDKNYDYGTIKPSGLQNIQYDPTGAKIGKSAILQVIGNGSNSIGISDFDNPNGDVFDNTNLMANALLFGNFGLPKPVFAIPAKQAVNDPDPLLLSSISFSDITQIAATSNFIADKAGTVNWAVLPASASAPSKAAILAGTGALDYNSKEVSAGSQNDPMTGFTYSTPYKFWYFTKSVSNVESNVFSVDFSTIARTKMPASVLTIQVISQTVLRALVDANVNGITLNIGNVQGGSKTLYENMVAGDLQAEDVTGLSAGTTRYFNAIALGDNITTVNSDPSIEYSGTTSDLIQLTAPTLGTPIVNSSTQITVPVSGINANSSNFEFEYKKRVDGGYTVHSATLPINTTQVVLNTLQAETLYDFRGKNIGGGNYSDSNYSNVVSATTASNLTLVEEKIFTDLTNWTVGVVAPNIVQASNDGGTTKLHIKILDSTASLYGLIYKGFTGYNIGDILRITFSGVNIVNNKFMLQVGNSNAPEFSQDITQNGTVVVDNINTASHTGRTIIITCKALSVNTEIYVASIKIEKYP